jgi:hypothetical protein
MLHGVDFALELAKSIARNGKVVPPVRLSRV